MIAARRSSAVAAATVVVGAVVFRPFSDLPFLWSRGIRPSALPYVDRVVEYPVVTGWTLWVVSLVARSATSAFVWWTVLAALLAAAATRLLQRLDARPVVAWTLAPQLAAYGAHNLDVVSIVPALGSLVAWEADAPVTAGVLAGVGASAKLWPAVVVVAIVAVGGRGAPAARRTAVAFFAAVGALNGPLMLVHWSGWWWTFAFQDRRGPTWGSVWFYVERWAAHGVPAATAARLANVATVLALGSATIGIVVVARRRALGVRPTAALLVLAWILSSKIYSPQYDLWLVPLLVACAVPSRHLWRLAVVDVAMFVVDFFPPFEEPLKGRLISVIVVVRLVVFAGLVRTLARREPLGVRVLHSPAYP